MGTPSEDAGTPPSQYHGRPSKGIGLVAMRLLQTVATHGTSAILCGEQCLHQSPVKGKKRKRQMKVTIITSDVDQSATGKGMRTFPYQLVCDVVMGATDVLMPPRANKKSAGDASGVVSPGLAPSAGDVLDTSADFQAFDCAASPLPIEKSTPNGDNKLTVTTGGAAQEGLCRVGSEEVPRIYAVTSVRIQVSSVARLGIDAADLIGRTLHVPKSELEGVEESGDMSTPKKSGKGGVSGSIQPNHQECEVKSYDEKLKCFLLRVMSKQHKGLNRGANVESPPANPSNSKELGSSPKEALHWLDLAEIPVWVVFRRGEAATRKQHDAIEPLYMKSPHAGAISENVESSSATGAKSASLPNGIISDPDTRPKSNVQLPHSPIAHVNIDGQNLFSKDEDNLCTTEIDLPPQKHLEALPPSSTSSVHLEVQTDILGSAAGAVGSIPNALNLPEGQLLPAKIVVDPLAKSPVNVLVEEDPPIVDLSKDARCPAKITVDPLETGHGGSCSPLLSKDNESVESEKEHQPSKITVEPLSLGIRAQALPVEDHPLAASNEQQQRSPSKIIVDPLENSTASIEDFLTGDEASTSTSLLERPRLPKNPVIRPLCLSKDSNLPEKHQMVVDGERGIGSMRIPPKMNEEGRKLFKLFSEGRLVAKHEDHVAKVPSSEYPVKRAKSWYALKSNMKPTHSKFRMTEGIIPERGEVQDKNISLSVPRVIGWAATSNVSDPNAKLSDGASTEIPAGMDVDEWADIPNVDTTGVDTARGEQSFSKEDTAMTSIWPSSSSHHGQSWFIWYEMTDPTSGYPYWINAIDGHSTWEPPLWIDLVDEESGCTYYINNLTGESQWETPLKFEPIARSNFVDHAGWKVGAMEPQDIGAGSSPSHSNADGTHMQKPSRPIPSLPLHIQAREAARKSNAEALDTQQQQKQTVDEKNKDDIQNVPTDQSSTPPIGPLAAIRQRRIFDNDSGGLSPDTTAISPSAITGPNGTIKEDAVLAKMANNCYGAVLESVASVDSFLSASSLPEGSQGKVNALPPLQKPI